MSMRSQRVEQTIRRVLADLLVRGELRDPRLRHIAAVSITGVKISPDLAQAQVYVDVLEGTCDLDQVLAGLNAGASVLRTRLGKRIRLKRTPSLHFMVDDSIEQGLKIEAVLAELRSEGEFDPPKSDDSDPEQ